MGCERNGWLVINIEGTPKQRGYTYGQQCADEFRKIQTMLNFHIFNETGIQWSKFIQLSKRTLSPVIKSKFPEFYTEMLYIAKGCTDNGTATCVDEIIAWNNYFLLRERFNSKEHCSAFICTGEYTKDGKIVVAHNSFSTYVDGQYGRVILTVKCDKGNAFSMITSACWIWSGADFFVTSKGIVGTETTIAHFKNYVNKSPISCRIRYAMQYGNTLDDFVKILTKNNSGDYANSWLLGDTNTNEIMRIELGLKFVNVERLNSGYFVGFNSTYDVRIRKLECSTDTFNDMRSNICTRRVRLTELMEKHKGAIDVNVAKRIIADHYDYYFKKTLFSNRCICSHSDEDNSGLIVPYEPKGAIDGTVADYQMIRNMSFWARYGSSCGKPFICDTFFKKHPQWLHLKPYLFDRPRQPWTVFNMPTFYKKTRKHKH